MEIPGLNSLREKFAAIDTQVLGISVDSKFCHKAWANGFGGIQFPLLADFHPKGGVAASYGLWLEDKGITDRATVLIGKDGRVKWAESVGPGGARVPGDLYAKTKELVA